MTDLITALILMGACDRPCVYHDATERALIIEAACAPGPVEEPSGNCRLWLAATWAVESRFALSPKNRGTGAGAFQVLPSRTLYTSRTGHVETAPGAVQANPAHSATQALLVARMRAWRCRGKGRMCLHRAYNSSPGWREYMRRIRRAYRRLEDR